MFITFFENKHFFPYCRRKIANLRNIKGFLIIPAYCTVNTECSIIFASSIRDQYAQALMFALLVIFIIRSRDLDLG